MAGRIYIYFITILIILLQGCSSIREARMLKQMNGKIPATSKWLGGKDGGVWVNIALKTENTFTITVFNDYKGEKINEFSFIYSCKEKLTERTIFRALNGFANGLRWKENHRISKCVQLVQN